MNKSFDITVEVGPKGSFDDQRAPFILGAIANQRPDIANIISELTVGRLMHLRIEAPSRTKAEKVAHAIGNGFLRNHVYESYRLLQNDRSGEIYNGLLNVSRREGLFDPEVEATNSIMPRVVDAELKKADSFPTFLEGIDSRIYFVMPGLTTEQATKALEQIRELHGVSNPMLEDAVIVTD